MDRLVELLKSKKTVVTNGRKMGFDQAAAVRIEAIDQQIDQLIEQYDKDKKDGLLDEKGNPKEIIEGDDYIGKITLHTFLDIRRGSDGSIIYSYTKDGSNPLFVIHKDDLKKISFPSWIISRGIEFKYGFDYGYETTKTWHDIREQKDLEALNMIPLIWEKVQSNLMDAIITYFRRLNIEATVSKRSFLRVGGDYDYSWYNVELRYL